MKSPWFSYSPPSQTRQPSANRKTANVSLFILQGLCRGFVSCFLAFSLCSSTDVPPRSCELNCEDLLLCNTFLWRADVVTSQPTEALLLICALNWPFAPWEIHDRNILSFATRFNDGWILDDSYAVFFFFWWWFSFYRHPVRHPGFPFPIFLYIRILPLRFCDFPTLNVWTHTHKSATWISYISTTERLQ